MRKKSQATNAVLTALFGPLGLVYASLWQAVILSIVALYLLGAQNYPWLAAIWILSIILGASAIKARNADIDHKEGIEERRHQELLEATRVAAVKR